jgi:serine-type anaerobic sulfatase-maturating enzyme
MQPILSLIVKTSSSCNLACRYCDADIYSNQRMSFEILAYAIKRALDAARNVRFIWHGGEPLLLGRNFYKKVVYLQQNCLSESQKVFNSLQTNGLLLDEEWLDFFDKYDFKVGLSLDGPEELHNKNRISKIGAGSYENVTKAISLMKKRNIPFGVLSVITDDTIKLGPKRFFDFFLRNDIKSFALLCQRPAVIVGQDDYMSRIKHSQFVNEIFDLWYERNDPDVHIRDFESILSALVGGEHRSCLLEGNCIGKYFGINFNGDVYHCDEFMFDSSYKLGNVITDGFAEMRSSKQISMLRTENESEIGNLQCKWTPVCNGGCPKDRYVAKIFSNGPIKCCGYADLIDHIVKRISEDPKIAKLKLESLIN